MHGPVRQLLRALERVHRAEGDLYLSLDALGMKSAQRQVQSVVPESDNSDGNTAGLARQAKTRDLGFSERLNVAMEGREDATVGRAIGVGKSLVGSWRRGTVPSGPTIFRLADELGVAPRWLATGLGPREVGPAADVDPDVAVLPRYDILRFAETGKPEPSDQVAVRIDWLARAARTLSGLWLADMPSDAELSLAREGDALVCEDVAPPLVDGRTYIFLLSGRPLVRKVRLRLEGLVLSSDDPAVEAITVTEDRAEDLVAVGRVLATIALRSV